MTTTVVSLSVVVSVAASACSTTDRGYLGKPTPPPDQRLVFDSGAEPGTPDPTKDQGDQGENIMAGLFEGLTGYHPVTLEPMAALATRYEVNANNSQFTFYLRGHPNPRGIRLPNTDTLRQQYLAGQLKEDFSRGHTAPSDRVPARWSDGTLITAHDFVYSWRRAVDPATAATFAGYVFCIEHAKDISSGTRKPEDLAVRALDDFTFQVDLNSPTSFFLKMLWMPVFAAVPRQAIEAARKRGLESSWTEPGNMITSGPFTLRERRPYDKVVIAKNPNYYEADLIALKEITFLPTSDGTTIVNLYKAGESHGTDVRALPPTLIPALRHSQDFHTAPALRSLFYSINSSKPPLDNVLVRYALNMATDKQALVDFLGMGQTLALSVVPPMEGYPSPKALEVTIDGKTYDVLAYNPGTARTLLARAGFPGGIGMNGQRLQLKLTFPSERFRTREVAEILQQQWRRNLNIEMSLTSQESRVLIQALNDKSYDGIVDDVWSAYYADPNDFLSVFVEAHLIGATWQDRKYGALLADANSTMNLSVRMKKLAEAESYLLKAMPIIPLFFDAWTYLQRPFVRGMQANLFGMPLFKYAWIDTNWKSERERN